MITGKIAYLHDETNPSWLPSLELGYTDDNPKDGGVERHARLKNRQERVKLQDAADSLLLLAENGDVSVIVYGSSTKYVKGGGGGGGGARLRLRQCVW